MPTKCQAIGCTAPSVAKGLCDKHRKRKERHGHIEQTRPDDWGDRNKHPLYPNWKSLRRFYRQEAPPEWFENFWNFVSDVPEKPNPKARIFRQDSTKPFSKDNFYWKESDLSDVALADRAAYMRAREKISREVNPEYHKNADLKKYYGVTLDWYKSKMAEQNYVCAICEQPETRSIRGRVLELAVDHCHATSQVRGLLCQDCNRGLGFFKDNADTIDRASEYLRGSGTHKPK
jgi:hypothetical protein